MIYYGSRLSENISKREPEGYLICKHVPIARTGTQMYLADELDLGGDPEKRHKVIRPEEEVFSPATIASFEGMPVTNDHPSGEVTVDNIQWLQKGHAQNIRRGTGDEADMLIADLIITDPETIQAVLDGKREISCGYNYDLSEEDGHFVQRQIRGNHIAIVDQGRAGHRVCIHDSKPKQGRRNADMKKANRKNILSKMFAAFAQDAEPEELEQAAEVLQDVAEEPEEIKPENTPMVDEDPMEARLAALEAKLDQLLAAKIVDADPEEPVAPVIEENTDEVPPEEDPLQKLQNDLDEVMAAEKEEEIVAPDEDPAEPEAHFVDPEELNKVEDEDPETEEEEATTDRKRTCDAARMALAAVRPVIAALPPAQRKRAADAAVKAIRKQAGLDAKSKSNGYLEIKKRTVKKAADTKADVSDLGKRIMEKRNVNFKK